MPIHQTCSESSASLWAYPTLTAINALALRKTAEDVALQVWLYLSLHRQLFRPSLLHWLEALFTPSWVTHHIILPYKNK